MVIMNIEVGRLLAALLTHHPVFCVAVVVSLHALLITIFAAMLAHICRRDPQWSHRIWFSAVTLLLVIIPLHVFQSGWPVGIVQTAFLDVARQGDGRGHDLVTDQVQQVPNGVGVSPAGQFAELLSADAASDFEVVEPKRDSRNFRSKPIEDSKPSTVPNQSPDQSVASVRFGLGYLLFGCYVLGSTVCLARLGWNMWRVRALTQLGTGLDDSSTTIFQQAARRVDLHIMPTIKLVDGVSMPLTCGILHSTVLLPNHFESWPPAEQQAVAMHELMHIKRRDLACEFLARVMRAFYWFHPVGAYLARQLTLTRELATDQSVVACGEEPHEYAKSVVDVLTRLNMHGSNLKLPTLPVVAMSAMGNLEARLQSILEQRIQRIPLLHGRVLISLLLAIGLLITMRIELVTAQTDLRSQVTTEGQEGDSQITTTSRDATAAESIQPSTQSSDSDLISRMRTCDVLTVTGEVYDAEFDVSGQVLSSSGQPVEGATVLLRESSTARISAEHEKYIYIPQRHLVRVNDVFARTISDRDGRFRFDGVKSPAMPMRWRNNWRGDVVAGHPQLGIGWVQLGSKRERHRVDSGLTLALRPTATVVGSYMSPEGAPLLGAVVYVYRCESPMIERIAVDNDYLDLQASQLTPRVTTDGTGKFSLSGIPEGVLARVIGADHAQWLGTHAVTATSGGIPLGRQKHFSIYGKQDVVVVQSPVTLVADPGVKIVGTIVDDQGIAIAGASVSISSSADSFASDQSGHFNMHQRTEFAKSPGTLNGGKVKLLIRPPKDSNLLMRYETVPVEELLSGKPIRLSLQRGARVSGKVVARDGQPLAEVRVSQLSDPDSIPSMDYTDESGAYELVLAEGQHTVVFGSDRPGYHLPSTSAIRVRGAGLTGIPHKTVDVSGVRPIELEPLVVERSGAVKVSVRLPGGQPAIGASVVLRGVDSNMALPAGLAFEMSKPLKDISQAAETDAMGRAELVPQGVSSEATLVEAKLDTPEASYHSVGKLSDAIDGVVQIELKSNWRLGGRVLLNGEPVAGAKISIGESNRLTGPGQGGGGVRTMFRNQGAVVTDAEGRYRVAVPADKQYTVSIQSIPGVVMDLSSRGYVAAQVSEGVLEVRDLNFVTGTEEIAGVVVDPSGTPLQGASITIQASPAAQPLNFIGHLSKSDSTTDANGRFHLRNVPKGKYELRVSPPFAGRLRANPSLIDATAGDMQMRITINTTPPPDVPRLLPQQFVDLPAGNRQAASIRGRLMHNGKPMAGTKLGIVLADRPPETTFAPLDASTDDDGSFRFDALPPSRGYLIYTMLDQTLAGVLPVSLVDAPEIGQVAELGEIATQPAQALTISVRTFDKSPLPAGGRLYVSRGRASHTPRLDLRSDGSFQADVVLHSVAQEMLEISVRVPGYKVLRTLPNLQRDWNHRYPLRFESTMTLIVVLTPDS